MNDFKQVFLISRPWLWPIPLLVYLGGLFYGFNADELFLMSDLFLGLVLFQIFVLTFPFGVAGYGLNDFHDRASDAYSFRKSYLKNTNWDLMYKLCMIFGLLILLSGLFFWFYFNNFYNLIFIILLLFFGWSYSSPPLRLKKIPFVNGLINSFVYFLFPLLLALSLSYSFPSQSLWIQVIGVLFYGISTTILANVVDYKSDEKAGLKTLPVRIGANKALFVSSLVCFIGFVLVFPQTLLYKIISGSVVFCLLIPVFFNKKDTVSLYVGLFLAFLFLVGCLHYIYTNFLGLL